HLPMLPVIRQSFIIVLALLQLFAPLVHAHTGSNSFNHGLHIPGLESYRAAQNTPVIQSVDVDWDSDGLLIVVDAGIKNPQDIFIESADPSYVLLPSDQLRIAALPKYDSNFSPQRQPFVFRRFPSTHPSRAPPAQ
ncbi:hypothetical protein, partial [Methyloglobulus morosus]|uniref:hypothetical protein n=1 Tax=Methyloglobulus morosus TaxID=1410681 RepID=UPI000686B1D0